MYSRILCLQLFWGINYFKGYLSIKLTIDFIADLQFNLFLVENDFQIWSIFDGTIDLEL